MMQTFHATVRGGRVTLDEPTDLPEGTVELLLAEDVFESPLDEQDRASLDHELEASMDEEDAGKLIDAEDVIAELRSMRRAP